jgi:hypothetical protein
MVILDQIQPKRRRIVLHFGRFVRETCCHLLPLFVELNLNRAFVRQFSVFRAATTASCPAFCACDRRDRQAHGVVRAPRI